MNKNFAKYFEKLSLPFEALNSPEYVRIHFSYKFNFSRRKIRDEAKYCFIYVISY